MIEDRLVIHTADVAPALAAAPTEGTTAAAEMRAASDVASLATSKSTAPRAPPEAVLAAEDHPLDTVVPTETEAMEAEEKRGDTLDPATETTGREDPTAEATHPTLRDEPHSRDRDRRELTEGSAEIERFKLMKLNKDFTHLLFAFVRSCMFINIVYDFKLRDSLIIHNSSLISYSFFFCTFLILGF